jgi:hypothetical protein
MALEEDYHVVLGRVRSAPDTIVDARKAKLRESFSEVRGGADGGIRTLMKSPSTDFLTTTAFAATMIGVCGLDYPFTIAFALGAARLVSTPSHCRAWLGIAI